MRRAYLAYGIAVLVLYAAAAWRGWGFPASRSRLPAAVREAPGGLRSYTYWRGGK